MNKYSKKRHKRRISKLQKLNLILTISLAILILLYVYYKEVDIKPKQRTMKTKIELEDIQNAERYELKNSKNDQKEELESSYEEVIVVDEQKEENFAIKQEEVKSIEEISYDFIVNEANATEQFINAIREQISLLPRYIIDSFVERKYTICITNQDLKDKLILKEGELIREDVTIYGLLDRTNQILYIKYCDRTKDNYEVLHEFGHYADFFVYGHPSGTDEFYGIYCEETEIVQSQTNTLISNPYEFYAETFKFAILEQNNNTKAYEYVKNSMQIE